MEKSDITKRPKRKSEDIAHIITKAGLGSIPIIGAGAAEIFSAIIVPPISKRRNEWVESIANKLKELEEKVEGFKVENLKNNEMFITTVMHASQAAIRNHQEEKLEALRNAILNSALPNPPQEDIQLMFLNFVDTLTPWHLRILKFFDDPMNWAHQHNISLSDRPFGAPATILEDVFNELKGNRDFYDQIVKDLYSRGLMSIESLHTTMTAQGMYAPRTTELGKDFIEFITSPIK